MFKSTILKHITKHRMQKTKELIKKKEYKISEISYMVDYKNPQHFTVAFKKFYGVLPSSVI
ncbi:helix-turn-helix domain-containing protein [uncultured Maribacter sp.]|uniref:helix-turn-helix domain-containing protein n=1 Tax=uncultured Maribacter sp. TaxID=431308 RepID=UPI0026258F14|nr:helix-turn-helix domain-containing protein [uncultured Maribacter sp.]